MLKQCTIGHCGSKSFIDEGDLRTLILEKTQSVFAQDLETVLMTAIVGDCYQSVALDGVVTVVKIRGQRIVCKGEYIVFL